MKAKVGDNFEVEYSDHTQEFVCPVCGALNGTNYDDEDLENCLLCNSEFEVIKIMKVTQIGTNFRRIPINEDIWRLEKANLKGGVVNDES